MNKLTIPPPPNWYESYIIACAIDNTVLYGTRNDIVIIHPKPVEEPADVKIIPHCHRERVTSINVGPNWGNPDKLAVSAGEDKVICLLDVAEGKVKLTHSGHTTRTDKLVGATFAGNDRVISVSEDGFIIIWRWANNQLNSLSDLFSVKVKITCISSCPHTSWLMAFGLKRGAIIITDLRKSGRVLYRLRGHDSSVLSLSWCPTPYNIFPKVLPKIVKEIKKKEVEDVSAKNDCETVSSQLEKEEQDIEAAVSTETAPFENQTKNADAIEIIFSELENKTVQINAAVEAVEEVCNDKCTTEKLNEHLKVEISQDNKETDLISFDVTHEKVEELHEESVASDSKESHIEDIQVEEGLETDSKENVTQNDESVAAVQEENLCETSESLAPTKDYLLASSARGGSSIMIWRTATDGIKQLELILPNKRGGRRSNQNEEKSWITVCWITPKKLLSSSAKGELLQWNLLNAASTGKGANKWRLIHQDHSKQLFSIAAPVRLYESVDYEDWRDKNLLNAWTVGKDRLILNTSLCAERSTLASYPTIGGSIFCLASSPVYPSRIAMGAGEGSCRLWDLSRSHLQYIVMTPLAEKTKTKITHLAWHPTKETILAFGTIDGRIGFMDPCNRSKAPNFMVQYTNGSVHRLEFAPLNGNPDHFVLFAAIAGKLIAYDVNKPLDAPIVFDVCEKDTVTQMSWKPDYSMCAVGTKAGSLLLFSPELKLLTTLFLHSKSVRWLMWHPEATAEDEDVSPYANWLAVATNNISVYDCSLNNDDVAATEQDYSERVVAVFTEHSTVIRCLSWSSFEGGKLASAAEDGSALVWDVKTKTLLHSCISSNPDVILSVLWSPLNGDYLITGGKNGIVQIWKLSENPPQLPPAKRYHYKMPKLTEKPEKMEAEMSDSNENLDDVEEIERPKKSSRKFMLTGLAEAQDPNQVPILLRDCKRLFALYYGKTENGESQNDNIKCDDYIDVLKLFGSEQDLADVLEREKNFNSKKTLPHCSAHISLWQGDIESSIRNAMANKMLSPWLVNMAPMVSHNLYLEVCEKYAEQLSEEVGLNAFTAASYYLACHKVESAIEVLCVAKKFREALVLAKCRLVPTDPIISKIIERWAKFCAASGNFEVAAQCYIVLQQLEDAAKVLFRREDVKTLEFCAEIAKQCDNKNLLDAVLFRLSAFKNGNASEDDVAPEVALLTRGEMEINREILSKQNENGGDARILQQGHGDEINKTELNGHEVTLGDGQCTTSVIGDDNEQNLECIEKKND